MKVYVPGTEEKNTYNMVLSLQHMGRAINGQKGADIASASTIDLEGSDGEIVDVTGTTTITAVKLSEGHEVTVRFTGVLTFTHGSSLVLPGGTSITTAAGDFATLRGYASGVVRCVNYTKASGAPVVPTLPSATTAAWTVWTPTVTPASGSFTTVGAVGAYLEIGKLVHFTVTITITTVGTASGAMSIALPVGTAKRPAAVLALETAVVGLMGYARIATGGSTIAGIGKYDNSSYIGAGHTITLTGIYEQA